ncbi:hypothetical protein [Flagellimonas nanhaiensis]|uniref:Uncharacterized protein n=1 Tax=Flagellimonas nanhaiensis TaxID=2292706 RepID=A0A371JSK3_9FLAO|nr:hypothetical protein [Allomuricauda nanhaiensis]RDY60792.1 hypothetical protein DX873_01010 [Allomuricauda nanhaiensis]
MCNKKQNLHKELIQNLDLPLQAYFGSLTPQKRDFSATHLRFKGYRDLLFKLESLLNVCILALDNPNSGNHEAIVEPDVSILSVLEMAAQLIPHEEAEFLDGVREQV